MGAIIGRGHIMDAAQETFISSTYWTDRVGPVVSGTSPLRVGRVTNVGWFDIYTVVVVWLLVQWQ